MSEAIQLVRDLTKDRSAEGQVAHVVLEGSETTNDASRDAKRRHLVGDALLGLWYDLQYCGPESFEDSTLTLGHAFQVSVDFGSTHMSSLGLQELRIVAPPSVSGIASSPTNSHNSCPRQDSNLRSRFRKPMLYPLSYEGGTSARSSARKSTLSLRRPQSQQKGVLRDL